jgi:hypothetical protein
MYVVSLADCWYSTKKITCEMVRKFIQSVISKKKASDPYFSCNTHHIWACFGKSAVRTCKNLCAEYCCCFQQDFVPSHKAKRTQKWHQTTDQHQLIELHCLEIYLRQSGCKKHVALAQDLGWNTPGHTACVPFEKKIQVVVKEQMSNKFELN